MKRRLFSLVVVILLASALVFLLAQGDGYLLIAYGNKTVEMTLWIAAILVLGFIGALWLLKKLLVGSRHLARRFQEIFMFGGVERVQKRANNGMVDFFNGDWPEARKKLVRSIERVEFSLPFYLAAARSSFEMGDSQEAERILSMAKKVPDSDVAIALMRARIFLQQGDAEKAQSIITPIYLANPKYPAVLDVLHHIYDAQQNWGALQTIFPELRRARVLSQPELNKLESRLAIEQLKELGTKVQQKLIAERLPFIEQVWKSFSKQQQHMPDVVNAYANILMQNYQDQIAEPIVRRALNEHWYAPLVNTYGRMEVKEIRNQIRVAEMWLNTHPNDPELLLALARMMERVNQMDTAKEYCLKSLRIAKNPEVAIELAHILEKFGDHKASADAYRQSLALVQQQR